MIRRVGRRGGALAFFGLVYLLIGASMFTAPTVSAAGVAQLAVLLAVLPLHGWGLVWLTVGGLSIAGALAKRLDRPAFTAGAGLALVWGLGLGAAWLLAGAPRAWVGAAIYLGYAAFIMLISGWPEVRHRAR